MRTLSTMDLVTRIAVPILIICLPAWLATGVVYGITGLVWPLAIVGALFVGCGVGGIGYSHYLKWSGSNQFAADLQAIVQQHGGSIKERGVEITYRVRETGIGRNSRKHHWLALARVEASRGRLGDV
mmetsp:Transcript_3380/g.9868  ORF Transcript_3380/g.9868 Transcript_3380/m.9868 type:complete len:127 (+) Transcript_3380:232-612(+)